MTKLVFIDTETTGLDDRRQGIWEIALIIRDTTENPKYWDIEYVWQLPVDLTNADPIALNIGKFHERRYTEVPSTLEYTDNIKILDEIESAEAKFIVPEYFMDRWCKIVVDLTRDAFLVGNVVSFDEERLRKLIRKYGQCHMWNYHLVDVEALVAGKLGMQPPWRGSTVAEAIRCPAPEDQHSALADARWARDMYDTVFESKDE